MTEVEEYEGIDDENENGPDDTVEPTVLKGTGENSGIFQSAKDAVVEIVNNVAKKFGKKDPESKNSSDKNNGDIVTLLSEPDFEDFDRNGFVMKCIEQTTNRANNSTLNPFCQFGMLFVFKKRMCPSNHFYTKRKSKKLRKPKSNQLRAGTKTNSTVPVTFNSDEKSSAETMSKELNTDGGKSKEFLQDKTTHNVDKNIETTQVVVKNTDTPHDIAVSSDGLTPDATCSTKAMPVVDVKKIIDIQASFNEAQIISPSSSVSTESLENTHVASTTTASTSDTGVTSETASSITSTPPTTKEPSTSKEQVDKTTEQSSKEQEKIEHVSSSVPTTLPSTSQSAEHIPQLSNEQIKKESVDVLEFETKDTEHKIIIAEKAKTNTDENEQTLSKSSEKMPSKNETNAIPMEKNGAENLPETTPSQPHSVQEIQSPEKSEEIFSEVESLPIETTSSFTPLATPPLSTQEVPPTQDASPILDIPNNNISLPLEKSTSKNVNKAPLGGIPGSKESIIVKLNAKLKSLQKNFEMSMMYLDEMSEK